MKMAYKTIVVIVAIVIAAFIVSCDKNKKEPGTRSGQGQVAPPPPPPVPPPVPPQPPPLIDKYDLLSHEVSKEWLRKNYWEVSYSDSQIIIQRNYQSGNITDRKLVSLGSKGQRGVSVVNNILFTVDDNDNIRVGIRKSESD